MVNGWDLAYVAGLLIGSPYWLLEPLARRKVLDAFSHRMGQVPAADASTPGILIHAVSLGEINATRLLVHQLLQRQPRLRLIISATTDTGFARGQELYGQQAADIAVIRYPLDFSWAIHRVLDRLQPSLVVLVELEIWPNLLHCCCRRRIPVMVVNGRMTEPSFRRYRLAGPLTRSMFRHLRCIAVQDRVNADRFLALGADPRRIHLTGTMKFDTASVASRVPGDAQLAADLGLRPGALAGSEACHGSTERIWVCGSTGPGEEAIILQQYRQLLAQWPGLRLILVPRHPQRFDEVACLIAAQGFGLVRRSQPRAASPHPAADAPPVILGDTVGELRRFYSLADVVFVGRTLVDLGPRQHGSDMIEPAALGKPVLVGPFTGNFADAMSRFRAADAICEVRSGPDLGRAVAGLLSDPALARRLGESARQVVLAEQGATRRNVELILQILGSARLRAESQPCLPRPGPVLPPRLT